MQSCQREASKRRTGELEREPEPCETLAQDCQNASRVDEIVERHDRIVGEPRQSSKPHRASAVTMKPGDPRHSVAILAS